MTVLAIALIPCQVAEFYSKRAFLPSVDRMSSIDGTNVN